MKAKRKRSIETDALSPEKRQLVNAFKRARQATAPPAGLKIDLEAVARKSITAYWKAQSARPDPADIGNPVLSPLDQGIDREHIKQVVLARIDPVRVFVQGILVNLLPPVAAAGIALAGYTLVQKSATAPWTNTLYQYGLPTAFLIGALGVIGLFVLKRPALLTSNWIVLRTYSGPLAGSLIVAAIVASLCISANKQTIRADQYKSEVQLESALTELQPIAAQVLSDKQSATQVPQDFDSKLQESKLAKRASIKKVNETNDVDVQIAYKIYFHIDSAGTPPLDVVVKPDRIEITRANEPGYVMLKDSISEVSADSFTLVSRAKSEDATPMPLTWDQSKTNEIKGSKVMVTYDEVLKKPVGVSLLDRPGMPIVYTGQNLDARIDRLAVTKTARAWQ